MSDEDRQFVYAYARKRLDDDIWTLDEMYTQVDKQVEIARVCAEARTNRIASLVVVVGLGLALVAVGAPWVALGKPTMKPSRAPDTGEARRERPPPRPPGLRPRPKARSEDGDPQP